MHISSIPLRGVETHSFRFRSLCRVLCPKEKKTVLHNHRLEEANCANHDFLSMRYTRLLCFYSDFLGSAAASIMAIPIAAGSTQLAAVIVLAKSDGPTIFWNCPPRLIALKSVVR